MCEILFAKAPDGDTLTDQQLFQLFKQSVNAANRNSDGYGIYNKTGHVIKSADKFTDDMIPELLHEYTGSELVVVHLRLKTNGSVCHQNSHPFTTSDGDIMCHNGVLSSNDNDYEINKSDVTDSYKFLKAFEHKDGDNVQHRIKKTTKNVSGSLSIVLLDNKRNLWYFRDGKPFNFARSTKSSLLIGATNESCVDGFIDDSDYDDWTKAEPDENTVWKIEERHKTAPIPVSDERGGVNPSFETKSRTYTSGRSYNNSAGRYTTSRSRNYGKGLGDGIYLDYNGSLNHDTPSDNIDAYTQNKYGDSNNGNDTSQDEVDYGYDINPLDELPTPAEAHTPSYTDDVATAQQLAEQYDDMIDEIPVDDVDNIMSRESYDNDYDELNNPVENPLSPRI